MFISGSDQFTPKDSSPKISFWQKPNFPKIMIIIVFGVFVLTGSVIFLRFYSKETVVPVVMEKPGDSGKLPPILIVDRGVDGKDIKEAFKRNNLVFGEFYKRYNDTYINKAQAVVLPTNIKTQAANYYDFTREINLSEEAIKKINQDGYVVIDNPFIQTANSFTSIYQELNKRNLPFLLTADYLFYYQQNYLKNIYKSIEADVFYKAFWEINLALFNQTDKRYRDLYATTGVSNDPVIEGLRLEAVYFAMNLELLKPKPQQIIPVSKQAVKVKEYYSNKFTQTEAQEYQFTTPDYLINSVSKELAFIAKNARLDRPVKSPALLYTRSYDAFKIPKDYASNEHLSNFYLATIWSRSVFPLFYKSADCPDCLLDESDWLINQSAAHLIARDLNAVQEIKNKWSRIYKVISYFNNLSAELTYLNYNDTFVQLFGTKKVEEVFAPTNPTRSQDLLALRNAIASISFDPAKGGLDKQTPEGKAMSGMRMLEEPNNPAYFVYNKLISPAVGVFVNYDKNGDYTNLNTDCQYVSGVLERCRAIGLDLINPIFDETITNDYFKLNTNYAGYLNQVPYLRNHFLKFTINDWHDNIYWSTMDTGRQFLNARKQVGFSHSNSASWVNQALTSVLGSTLNSQLPADIWQYTIKTESGLETQTNVVKSHYIEPNLRLISEIQSNAEMVFEVFAGLGVVQSNDNSFAELKKDLDTLRQMVLKEMTGTDFTNQEWLTINEIVNRFTVVDEADKIWRLNFVNKNTKKVSVLEQSLVGVKLLIEVVHQQSKDVLVAGPVFQFKETKR